MRAGANEQRPLREDLKVQKLMKRVEMQLAREAKTKRETSQASPTKN
jgi:hypothetical protein